MSTARRIRLFAVAAAALVSVLALAPGAMAADGVGLWGRTDDKVITFFAFAVMAFFAVLVTVLSLIQIRAREPQGAAPPGAGAAAAIIRRSLASLRCRRARPSLTRQVHTHTATSSLA